MIGRDLVQISEERYVVDFSGLSLEEARHRYPLLLQKIIDEVQPARDTSNDQEISKGMVALGTISARHAIGNIRPESVHRYLQNRNASRVRLLGFGGNA